MNGSTNIVYGKEAKKLLESDEFKDQMKNFLLKPPYYVKTQQAQEIVKEMLNDKVFGDNQVHSSIIIEDYGKK